MLEEPVQKFHTKDTSLPRSGSDWLKCPDLGSDVPSEWKFGVGSSDIILWGN